MSNNSIKTIWVKLENHSYPIHIGKGTITLLNDELSRLNWQGKIGIVTDENVEKLHLRKITSILNSKYAQRYVVHTLPAGEETKTLQTIESICSTMLAGGLDRTSGIIALGGGVVGDIAGFFSACYMRGIPFIQIPTTIVAQVDASIGGKTGVNHPLGKNILGAFYQPQSVIIDVELLNTLPDRIYHEGFAEIIKHGVIADAELFHYCLNHAESLLARDLESLIFPILRSCEIKSDIVMKDEKEQSIRAYLNYGHTFGHAIETVTQYNQFLHGEAVSLGMICASELACLLGLVPHEVPQLHRVILEKFQLPTRWDEIPIEKTYQTMFHDKKAKAGKLRFILPRKIGSVDIFSNVPEELVRKALETLAK